MKIPIFKLHFEKKQIEKYKNLSKKIFQSDALSEGKITRKFESLFRKKNNSKFAIAISSGTSALIAAFEAIDIRGYEVIIPCNTFFGTSIPVEVAGGKIILCDNQKKSPFPSLENIKKKITDRTKAICIVHVGGIIFPEIIELANFCKKKKIFLIEDCAHAHFSEYNKKKAGNFGDIGCFSFYPTKVMTSSEGGMIVTKNKSLYKKINSIKNFGRMNNPLFIDKHGFNFKISEFSSLIGLLELERVEKRIKKRTLINSLYKKKLNNFFFEVLCQTNGFCANYKCIVYSRHSRKIISRIKKMTKISFTGKVWEIPLHRQPKYKKLFDKEKFTNSEEFSKNHFCLPNYPELTLKEIDYICKTINTLV